MRLRQALLFSSQRTAMYETTENIGYVLRVKAEEKAYKPLIALAPGPYMRDEYTLSIALQDAEPHRTYPFLSIDDVEKFLQAWKMPIDSGWGAVELEEVEDEQTLSKQNA